MTLDVSQIRNLIMVIINLTLTSQLNYIMCQTQSTQNISLNYSYEFLVIDTVNQKSYFNLKEALLEHDIERTIKLYSEVLKDFDMKTAMESDYIKYQKLVMPDIYVNSIESLLVLSLGLISESNARDKKSYNEMSVDFKLSLLFHYYMNARDSMLWGISPYYYLPHSYISHEQLDQIYKDASPYYIEDGLFNTGEKWRSLTQKQINQHFLSIESNSKVTTFFYDFFASKSENEIILMGQSRH